MTVVVLVVVVWDTWVILVVTHLKREFIETQHTDVRNDRFL